MIRACWLFLCVLLTAPGSARAVVAMPGVVNDQTDTLLVVGTSGYSRFEVSEGAVVAFYTGGVTASYSGFTLTCESLWLNQSAQTARLSGEVSFNGAGARLSCPELKVDMRTGAAELLGGVQGALVLGEGVLSLACGSIELELPDPQEPPSAQNLNLALRGTVLVNTADRHRLSAEELDYAGRDGVVTARDGFTAVLNLPANDEAGNRSEYLQAGRHAGPTLELPHLQTIYISGQRLTAKLTSEGELAAASVELLLLTGEGMRFTAQLAEVVRKGGSQAGETLGYQISMQGNPILATVMLQGGPFFLAARELTADSAADEPRSLVLAGEVRVSGLGLKGFAAEMLLQLTPAGGYSLGFPQGLRVGGNLAQLSNGSLPGFQELLRAR